jgi:uncharacterized protein YigE (DUF2233 family)
MKIKNIKFYLPVLFLALSLSACRKSEDGIINYTAVANTATGNKLLKTGLIATVFKDSTYTVTDGVQSTEVFYFSKKGYAMRVFLFEIDLTNPKISIEVSTPNNANAFALQQMTAQATYEDAAGHLVWGGVNGSFFNVANGTPNGLFYKNGTQLQTFSDAYPNFFVITKDKTALIADSKSYDAIKANIFEAVGGGVMLVSNNNLVAQTEATPSVNPRTFIGVTEDQKKVYIAAVDGRNYHYSNGMTYEEEGKIMIALGAKNALNLDGGGSTTFFVRNTPDFTAGRFKLRNWPSENGGAERSVGNGLLIISK